MPLNLPKRFNLVSPSHARAKVMEKATAKRIGGRQTKGSGSSYEKGDVRLKGVVRIESKTTKNASFSVTAEMITKIEDATVGTGEIPVIEVEILSGRHKAFVIPDWALDMFIDMCRPKTLRASAVVKPRIGIKV